MIKKFLRAGRRTRLCGLPEPFATGDRKADQVRKGYYIHDWPEGRHDRPVFTEWHLSFIGRLRMLFTGKLYTVVWDDNCPLMSVEHVVPKYEPAKREGETDDK